ncbi:OmpA family protein [Saprospiraceae bacterium]|nr:OmpA family protein [Saprospiraceae bacterium]
MIRLILSTILLSCLAMMAFAQDYTERKDITKKEVKKLREAINSGRSNGTDKAINVFDKLLKKYPDFVEIYLRKGSIHYQKKEYLKAKESFLAAIAKAPEFDPEMYFSTALTLYALEEYGAAGFHFEGYLERGATNKRKEAKARRMMQNSNFAHEALQNPVTTQFDKLPASINTSAREYGATESIDGESILFVRRDSRSDELMVATKDGDDYLVAPAFAEFDEFAEIGTFSFSANGKFVVFTSCNNRNGFGGCDLYYSRIKNGQWIAPRNMGLVINTPAWESQPSLSADGSALYFSSNRKHGLGGKDIWVSLRGGDRNGWTMPINLGANINTKENEESPFIHADGYTLYFRSNGLPGMGDFDNYFSARKGDHLSWSKAVNMGYPINTLGHDGGLTVSLDGERGYTSTDREFLENRSTNTNLEVFTFPIPEYAKPILTTYLKVNVVDALTKKPISANKIDLADGESGAILSRNEAEDGVFITSLPTGRSYGLSVEMEDYIFQSRYFDLAGINNALDPYVITVEMVPVPKAESPDIVYDTPIVLNNIFFEIGSSKLKDVSMVEINRLSETLKSQPTLKILIKGHTDKVGDSSANKKLSEDRAKAVFNALATNGIELSRLSYIGVGEANPIDTNDTDAGRKSNRRTEFILIR